MKRRTLVLFLLALSCAWAQDVFDEIVRQHGDRFMGVVLVARGGEVLFSRGYGQANVEWNIANTPEAKFRLGSVTKQFTAASILLLEERGKLSVADPVNKYLADGPAAWKGVTIHHLLTHTSGIPSFTGFPEYAEIRKRSHTPEQLVALFRGRPLEFPRRGTIPLQQLGVRAARVSGGENFRRELRAVRAREPVRSARHEGLGIRPRRHRHPAPRLGLHIAAGPHGECGLHRYDRSPRRGGALLYHRRPAAVD